MNVYLVEYDVFELFNLYGVMGKGRKPMANSLKVLKGTPLAGETERWGIRFKGAAPYEVLRTPATIHDPTPEVAEKAKARTHWDGVVQFEDVSFRYPGTDAWVLRDGQVQSVLIGASKVSQVQENIECTQQLSFTNEELSMIDKICEQAGIAL